MWLPVFFGQWLHVVHQRVRKVGRFLVRHRELGRGGGGGEFFFFFFDFLVPPWGLVHSGDAGFAGFFPFCVQGLGYEGVPSLWGGQHQRYP